eukprot:TRINITY_DN50548_c0_g2_i2.p1 TRINITY_DN50548_c0_g2~~TRINITY_DN50548_c0_g2_i2.p1  ORF type:complete len:334 (+),score=67.94 TRINITY_DN50548_c0_g2_i2:176-1177(+)
MIFRDDQPVIKKACVGRPEDSVRFEAFKQTIQYLDSLDDDQVTVHDLVDFMQDMLKNTKNDAYSVPHMKVKLSEHYGDEIMFAHSHRKTDVISLKTTADSILQQFFKERRESSTETEKMRLIKAAAKIIRNDIKSLLFSKDSYPDAECIENHSDILPATLSELLKQVTNKAKGNVKLSSIGQAIIQCTRPNTVIAPLQIGLAVQMHRTFGSRFLVDTLHRLGFCSSYSEVRKFQRNAASTDGLNLLPPVTDNNTIQFVADNVDHNSATLDGRGTFHGMGIIATVTPGVKKSRQIPRKDVNLREIQALGQINIQFYRYVFTLLHKDQAAFFAPR